MTRLFCVVLVGVLMVAGQPTAFAHEERADLGHFTLLDEEGVDVLKTGIVINVGDRFISPDNREFEVVRVVGDEAHLKALGSVDLEEQLEETTVWVRVLAFLRSVAPVQTRQPSRVAIYHTHSDESYEPTDGSASIPGRGGVMKVGDRFREALVANGIEVEHDRTSHDPHDAGAYERSRRTAVRLNGERPAAIFDVHRDTPPREVYLSQIGGQDVAQILLVLGRQNHQVQANQAFAKRVKAEADRKHPGLIRGILVSTGKYNQDIHPRNLLLEVGSYQNSREEAERGISLFAEVIPGILGAQAPGAGEQGRTGLGVIGVILAAVVLGGAAYLLISTGSLKEAKAKVKRMVTEEFTSFLSRRPVRKGGSDPGENEEEGS